MRPLSSACWDFGPILTGLSDKPGSTDCQQRPCPLLLWDWYLPITQNLPVNVAAALALYERQRFLVGLSAQALASHCAQPNLLPRTENLSLVQPTQPTASSDAFCDDELGVIQEWIQFSNQLVTWATNEMAGEYKDNVEFFIEVADYCIQVRFGILNFNAVRLNTHLQVCIFNNGSITKRVLGISDLRRT